MQKLKLYREFINEWFLPPTDPITLEDMEKSLGYTGSLGSTFEQDANRIKGLLWLYFLDQTGRKKDGFGFDYTDMIYFTQLAEKVMASGELLPLEMEQIRAKMLYYAGQFVKIANYERKNGPDGDIEKYLNKWKIKNANKYKAPEITPKPKLPKQGDLF